MTRTKVIVVALWILALMAFPSGSTVFAGDIWNCETVLATPVPAIPSSEANTNVDFPARGGELTIFAAASLTDAFTDIGTAIESHYPDVSLTFNFAGSQALVTQTIEGAPADVLALADTQTMEVALQAGVVTSQPQMFASNSLAIVVPTDNPAGIESASDLAQDDLRLVLAAPGVPAGHYARESLCLMAEDAATYGNDFVEHVADNIVSEEDDVRSVLTKVTLGEADAGIVYRSDISENVIEIPIPDQVNVVAEYPIAPVADGDTEQLALAFIGYVRSPTGQQILANYGFAPSLQG